MNNLIAQLQRFYFSKHFILISFFIGVFLRLRQYFYNRSLWIDEAALAVNFVGRSFSELLLPLKYGQAAPLGFVMAQKCAVTVFGPSEYALRFFPLLAGIVAIFIFYRIVIKLLDPATVPLALGIFAVCQPLIYFSSEVKQYSFDVVVTLAIVLLGIRMLNYPPVKPSQALIYGFLGSISLWFSFPAIFVLSAIALVLIVNNFAKQPKMVGGLFATLSLWFLSFIGLYFFVKHYVPISIQNHLSGYWDQGFMPISPSIDSLKWYARTFLNTFKFPGGFALSALAGLTALAGVTAFLFNKKYVQVGFVVAPIGVVLVASALGKYPFSDRLILFIVPLLIICIAQGALKIFEILTRYHKFFGMAYLVVLLVFPLSTAVVYAVKPITREEIRPAIEYFKKNAQSTDVLYVYNGGEKAMDFYLMVEPLTQLTIIGKNSRDDESGYIRDLKPLEGKARVWILFSHIWTTAKVNERAFILDYLDKVGRRMDEFVIKGNGAIGLSAEDSGIYLYDLSRPVAGQF